MLIFDGHGSYLTDEFTYYCWAHDIIPFKLLPHSTHLLQPLDIGVFQPFKHRHQVALHEEVRYRAFEFSKLDFLSAFQRIHERTFKKSTIISAWAKAGLFPYNPTIVKDKMKAFETPAETVAIERPKTLPNPQPQPFLQTTTTETRQAHKRHLEVSWMDSYCLNQRLSPSFFKSLAKFKKFSESKVLQTTLMQERELKQSQSEQARIRRKAGSGGHVQSMV